MTGIAGSWVLQVVTGITGSMVLKVVRETTGSRVLKVVRETTGSGVLQMVTGIGQQPNNLLNHTPAVEHLNQARCSPIL